MRTSGLVFFLLGLLVLGAAALTTVSVDGAYNLGLLALRLNMFIIGGVFFLAGCILWGCGEIAARLPLEDSTRDPLPRTYRRSTPEYPLELPTGRPPADPADPLSFLRE